MLCGLLGEVAPWEAPPPRLGNGGGAGQLSHVVYATQVYPKVLTQTACDESNR